MLDNVLYYRSGRGTLRVQKVQDGPESDHTLTLTYANDFLHLWGPALLFSELEVRDRVLKSTTGVGQCGAADENKRIGNQF